ncbi:MAG: hypothetical protein JWO36_2418 [Myxococcales bacterium]|nr:hypothetical protein [Myxococcales bacterium]
MTRALMATLLTGILMAGCGAQWPSHTTMAADRGFLAKQKQVHTVDVLPMRLELWTGAGYDANVEELRSGAETRIMNTALSTLAERNYAVAAVIDWDGNAAGGNVNALAKSELMATLAALSRYGATVAEHPGEVPIPFLPARLGTGTNSDATLFVGGWAFVGTPQESTASKVAKGVAIGLLIVTAVVVIAVAVEALGAGDKHESRSHGREQVRDHRGGDGESSLATRGSSASSRGITFGAETAVDVIDAFGRTAELAAQMDWSQDEALPHEGDSQMYLEMTLVDNRSGLTLWHVHQQFPANAAGSDDVDRVAHTMLASLPAN